MKRLQINLRSIVIKILFLLLFVVSGCSQRNSRDEKSGPFKQKIIVANRTDEKTANSDTIKLIELSLNKIVCVKNKLKIKKVPGPFKTNVEADSICWELVSASQGIAIEPERGKGDNCNVTFIRENRNSTGVIILKATPFKALFISKPAEVKYLLQKCRDTCPGKVVRTRSESHGCSEDTTIVNRLRRNKIAEFRDLLFMFAKTTSAREKEYFRTDAGNKLNEIPNRTIDMLPHNELNALFDDTAWSNPVVIPLYDRERCYIVGIKVRQK